MQFVKSRTNVVKEGQEETMPHLNAQMARILMKMPHGGTTVSAECLSAVMPNLRPPTILDYLHDLYHLGLVCHTRRKAGRTQRTTKDSWRVSAEGRRVLAVFTAPF